MENCKDLVSEITQGKELVNQLRLHLSYTSTTGEFLIEKIVTTLNNALSILNWDESKAQEQVPRLASGVLESMHSGSQGSEETDVKSVYKKRKMMFRWTEQVRVTSETGIEGPPEDGHSWRKYGQKDILGAKYPRGYYRCTHRNVKGCLARRQVQRSDEDPLVFEVTYRGKHTCAQASESPVKQDQKQKSPKQSEELLKKLRSELKVKTENQSDQEHTFSPFSFPSTAPIEDVKLENNIFPSLSLDSSYMDSFSPFITPTTPESNYFTPCHMNNFGGRTDFCTLDSDLHEMISASTSPSNSPVIGLDFTLESLAFDSSFPFDNPNYFN